MSIRDKYDESKQQFNNIYRQFLKLFPAESKYTILLNTMIAFQINIDDIDWVYEKMLNNNNKFLLKQEIKNKKE